jgi:glycosyltransferase involved in cell wall biosynthesis
MATLTNVKAHAANPIRLAFFFDYPEEGWPSMDLCANMLVNHFPGPIVGRSIKPPFRRRFSRLPWLGRKGAARNADRLANRLWDYPRFLRQFKGAFDAYHVCDHSYSHLLHYVPEGRGGVFCHDLDTFRCLLEPKREPRPLWFRRIAAHVLAGMQKAAVVFHTTEGVRRQILAHRLIAESRLVHAPLGVSPEFRPDPSAEPLPFALSAPFLLHVGSSIPRKRLDVLLDVFAAVRQRRPGLRLIQIGGQWTAEQSAQAARLGIASDLTQARGLTRGQLAVLYQTAAMLLQPSEAEGFGIPIIEALACGAVVVASDLPTLREVGGDAVIFCGVADTARWSDMVERLLADPAAAPPLARRYAQAQRFSWSNHAQTIANAYLGLFQAGPKPEPT